MVAFWCCLVKHQTVHSNHLSEIHSHWWHLVLLSIRVSEVSLILCWIVAVDWCRHRCRPTGVRPNNCSRCDFCRWWEPNGVHLLYYSHCSHWGSSTTTEPLCRARLNCMTVPYTICRVEKCPAMVCWFSCAPEWGKKNHEKKIEWRGAILDLHINNCLATHTHTACRYIAVLGGYRKHNRRSFAAEHIHSGTWHWGGFCFIFVCGRTQWDNDNSKHVQNG